MFKPPLPSIVKTAKRFGPIWNGGRWRPKPYKLGLRPSVPLSLARNCLRAATPGARRMLRLASDIDVNGRIIRGLRRRCPEIDLLRAQDALPNHGDRVPDPDILAWA